MIKRFAVVISIFEHQYHGFNYFVGFLCSCFLLGIRYFLRLLKYFRYFLGVTEILPDSSFPPKNIVSDPQMHWSYRISGFAKQVDSCLGIRGLFLPRSYLCSSKTSPVTSKFHFLHNFNFRNLSFSSEMMDSFSFTWPESEFLIWS